MTDWFFGASSEAEIETALVEAGFSESDFMLLSEDGRVSLSEDGEVRVFPSAELVASLAPEGRASLYRHLARWEENRYQRLPVVIEAETTHEWFRGAGLRRELIDIIDRHVYPGVGGVRLFSDVPQVLAAIGDPDEEIRLLQALTRARSHVVRLVLNEQSDLDSIADYWSSQGLTRQTEGILHAAARTPGIDRLDITHLLPAMPRSRLNTFPTAHDALDGRLPDDFWTAINFFNFVPKNRYQDSLDAHEYFSLNFRPVLDDWRYGDVLLVSPIEGGRAVHACIHLADDLVFTRHGAMQLRPWVVDRLPAVMARYGRAADLAVSAWRRNRAPR